MILKSGLGVVQGHRKWRRLIDHVRLTIFLPWLCLVPFLSYLTNNIVTLKSGLEVIQTSTIRKLGCGFLFAFHSTYGRIFNCL